MACPQFVDRKKSFYVVAIALSILVLCTTIFALAFWESTSRNNEAEKNGNVFTTIFSVGTTTKVASSKRVSFLRDTTIPSTRYERKTESYTVGTTTKATSSKIVSFVRDTMIPSTSFERKTESSKAGTTTKTTSSKMISLLRDTTIPATSHDQKAGPSKVGTTTKAASSKMIPLLRDTTIPATSYEQKAEPSKVGTTIKAASTEMIPLLRDTLIPATSYEPKIESSKMKILPFTSNVEKRLDEIACSHIDISSNLAMNEQYPKLFGAYERVGLINGRVMYRNPKTRSEAFYSNSIYHSNYHDNQKETEEYRSKWAVLFEDYLAFDINCNDIMPTNSNCNPEWRFCNASVLDVLELKLDCVIVDTITFQCKNDSMEVEPIEDNQEKCQELEFSSNDGIAKTIPELMGIYSLEDHLYNDMAVYVHKDMGFNLYYRNYSTDYQNSLIAINQKNQTWVIDNGTYLLADNFICTDTDVSMDGNCEFGWAYWNNDHRNVWIDWSASIICVKPSPVVTNIPTSVTCQTFQLMSTTAFELGVPVELYLLGEYVITESTNNGMVVYRNRYTSYFLYFVVNINTYGIGDNYWAIGPEVGHEYANLFNRYCSNLENPANGNCKYGWFYYNAESKVWKYDMNMRIQCTNYSQNSIT